MKKVWCRSDALSSDGRRQNGRNDGARQRIRGLNAEQESGEGAYQRQQSGDPPPERYQLKSLSCPSDFWERRNMDDKHCASH